MGAFKSIVLENAFLHSAIWKFHTASTVLDPMSPLTFVMASIVPKHLPISMTLIVFVTALIVVARLPNKEANTIFLIVLVVALESIAVLAFQPFLPFSFAMFEAILELTNIDASIFPLILALALRFAIIVDTCEYITISKEIRALTVLKAIEPFSFKTITIFPLMYTISGRL